MELLKKMIKIKRGKKRMKIVLIDNPALLGFENAEALFGAVKNKKLIILPQDLTDIKNTGGYLPHIKRAGHYLKYCHKCKKWLLLGAFNKNKFSKDGLKDACSECDNKRRRDRYAKTKRAT
jgi:RNase P subunit RPR2